MTATMDQAPNRQLDFSATRPIPFGRLVGVELRKTFDTRAGFWLLLVIGLAELLALVIPLLVGILNDGVQLTLGGLAQILAIPMQLLVPIFAIMTVTSEWGQRTTLATFALVPKRLRVIAAKFATVLIVAIATIVFAVILGVVGNALYGLLSGDEVSWAFDLGDLGWTIAGQFLGFIIAFGLGLLLLSTPGAIVAFYAALLLLPSMVYAPLMAFFETAREIIPWVDVNIALAPLASGGAGANPFLTDTSTGMALAHTLVACLIWVGIPLVLGSRRVSRTEFK